MPGKPRPTPPGHVKLKRVEKDTKGRWKAATLRRCIRDGTWEDKTGLSMDVLHIRPRAVHIKRGAAAKLIRDARRHTVNITSLARELGMEESALHRVKYMEGETRWVGDGWYTTPEVREKLLRRRAVKENSYGTHQLSRLWGRDPHTVQRWIERGIVPCVSEGAYRVPKEWAERNAERLTPDAGRFVRKPAHRRGKEGRWVIGLGARENVVGNKPSSERAEAKKKPPMRGSERLRLIKERHRRLKAKKRRSGREDPTAWLEEE